MAFIVKKKISGKEYFYLNETKREGGKVVSKCLGYLGKDRKEAEKKAEEILKGSDSVDPRKKVEEISRIASTKGFFFQTAGLYGGSAGFYTYGHLGKLLKNQWENLWRDYFLGLGENFHEIQSNNILPEEVFRASGHIENFNDPMAECKKCHFRFRADQFLEDKGFDGAEGFSLEEINEAIQRKGFKCPKCGGEISDAKQFNMMFSVDVGFNDEKAYLSPETAQGSFITFMDEFKANREKLPLGLAIVDKAYRNEISPRQMFFRLREFSQAELQIFFDPEKIGEHEDWESLSKRKIRIKLCNEQDADVSCADLNEKGVPKFYLYYVSKVQDFYLNILGLPKNKFRFRELSKKERAFYNRIHFDVEVFLDSLGGFKEVAGVHYRGDHDLSGHAKVSGKKMEVFYDGKRFVPHVLELSFGVDRNIWGLLDVFFGSGKEGSMFKFPPKIAPVKAAVFPIVKKPEFKNFADEVFGILRRKWKVVYDKSGSIGRRYARNDEIGTAFCITIDGDSLDKKDVTIRERDTGKQIRVKVKDLEDVLENLVEGKVAFEKCGKPI